MTKRIKIYTSQSVDPWFNLATEDWLFQELEDFDHVLFLWRNADTVVIGRSQNPWAECHLEKMQADNVKLARCQSGGGAVFHDLGNTNFTFLSRKKQYDKQANFSVILNALKQFGIVAETSGRNDIIVALDDNSIRKISGNAFKEKVDRAFHHGTLLINTDLSRLPNYLNPNKKKLEAKGIKSVRSRVINATELNTNINHEQLCSAIIEEFQALHDVDTQAENLDLNSLASIESLQKYYQQLKSWDWLYGQTLEFTHRFEERLSWGSIECQFLVKNAIIEDARIYSDSLYPDLISTLEQNFKHKRYDAADLDIALTAAANSLPHHKAFIDELRVFSITT